MTSEQIAELRRLEASATKAPWFPQDGHREMPPKESYQWGWVEDAAGGDVITWGHDEGGVERDEDGRFIIAMRNAFKQLLDEREALLEAAKAAQRAMWGAIAVLRERNLSGGSEEVEELLAPIAAAIAKAESP